MEVAARGLARAGDALASAEAKLLGGSDAVAGQWFMLAERLVDQAERVADAVVVEVPRASDNLQRIADALTARRDDVV